jgi:Uma2 family endonuclease
LEIEILPKCNYFVMWSVSWGYYDLTIRELGPSRATRVTFDRGDMELRKVQADHEAARKSIGRIIDTYSLVANVRASGRGQLVCRRKDLQVGFDPDDCYYVRTAAPKGDVESAEYPIPDLVLELAVTKGKISRLDICATLGVPEVWHFDGARLSSLHLGVNRQYHERPRSLAFPKLPMDTFRRFVDMAMIDQHDGVMAFKDWLEEKEGRA